MANLSEESLFSLELAVEEVAINHTVACRFPSVAFRLLDFPTLVIHHVNVELVRNIRTKIELEPRYKPPLQYHELQNSSGNFPVKRGKSCLFRVSPNVLHAQLISAPLYVMIMDTFPEVPKLIASCTIPLDSAVSVLYESIASNGLSIPATGIQKGSFDVFNLMGRHLGFISLAVRLISLGPALLYHMPDGAVTRIGDRNREEVMQSIEKETVKQVSSVQAAGKPARDAWVEREKDSVMDEKINVAVEAVIRNSGIGADSSELPIDISPSFDAISTQTERKRLENTATQTVKKKKSSDVRTKSSVLASTVDATEEVDFTVTNIDCPPPLFYNSKYDEPRNAYPTYGPYEARNGPYQSYNPENLSSDDETIRTEDVYSDSEFPDHGFLQRKHIRGNNKKNETAESKSTVVEKQKTDIRSDPVMKSATLSADMAQFPILKALMGEIMKLQGSNNGKDEAKLIPELTGRNAGKRSGTPLKAGGRAGSKLGGMNQPKNTPVKKDDSLGPAAARNKSWLREHRQFVATPVQTRKISYTSAGMTRTQRLRLKKTNPQLLEKLDAKENERVSGFREQERISRLQRYPRDRAEEMEKSLRREDYGRTFDKDDGKGSPSRRKPVPTPRASIVSGSKEANDTRLVRERKTEKNKIEEIEENPSEEFDDKALKQTSTEKILSSTYKVDQGEVTLNPTLVQSKVIENNETRNVTDQPDGTLLADQQELDNRIKDMIYQQLSKIMAETLREQQNKISKPENDVVPSRSGVSLHLPSSRGRSVSGGGGMTDRTHFEYSDDFEVTATAREDDDVDISHLRMVVEVHSDDNDDDNDDDDDDGNEAASPRGTGREPKLERYIEPYRSDSDEEMDQPLPDVKGTTKPSHVNTLGHISEESQNSTSEFLFNEDVVRSKMIHSSASEFDDESDDDAENLPLGLKIGQLPNPSHSTRSPTVAAKGELESARQPIAGSSTPTVPSPNTPSSRTSPRKPFQSKSPEARRSMEAMSVVSEKGDEMSSRKGTLTRELENMPTPSNSNTVDDEFSFNDDDYDKDDYNDDDYNDDDDKGNDNDDIDDILVLGDHGNVTRGRYTLSMKK